jgi:hypothetical protein
LGISLSFCQKYSSGLRSVEFAPVLCDTHLSDGTGFGLLGALAGLPVTAFLYLPVETTCFWLPAIDAGGSRATQEILKLAQMRKWDTVVIGRKSLSWLGELIHGDPAEELVRQGKGFTIWVVE